MNVFLFCCAHKQILTLSLTFNFSHFFSLSHSGNTQTFTLHLFFICFCIKWTLHDISQHNYILSCTCHNESHCSIIPYSWNRVKVQKAFVSALGDVLLIFFHHHNPQRHWSIGCYISDQDPFFSSRGEVRSPLLWPIGRLHQYSLFNWVLIHVLITFYCPVVISLSKILHK